MNWHDVIAMGGYAPYVWGSVLAFVAALVVEWIVLARRHRCALAGEGEP